MKEEQIIIIRYGEIGLKQKITRRFFENILIGNIRKTFQKYSISFEIKKKRARIYIKSSQIEECLKILSKIFGISSFSAAYKTKADRNSLDELALKIKKNIITKNTSFALKVNRTGNHDFTSQDIAIHLGAAIQRETKASVDLSKPDIILFVEIIEEEAFLFFEKTRGQGGLPIGTQGKALSLVESKNSLLATWFLMRRGCKPIFLIKDESMISEAEKFANNWLCSFNIEKNNISNLDIYSKQKKCDAIVTGYRFEDIKEIEYLKRNVETPVLHPLIGLNQEEIEKKLSLIEL